MINRLAGAVTGQAPQREWKRPQSATARYKPGVTKATITAHPGKSACLALYLSIQVACSYARHYARSWTESRWVVWDNCFPNERALDVVEQAFEIVICIGTQNATGASQRPLPVSQLNRPTSARTGAAASQKIWPPVSEVSQPLDSCLCDCSNLFI